MRALEVAVNSKWDLRGITSLARIAAALLNHKILMMKIGCFHPRAKTKKIASFA